MNFDFGNFFGAGKGLGFNMDTLNLVKDITGFVSDFKTTGLQQDALKQNMALSKADFNNTLKRQKKFDDRSVAVNNQMKEYEKGNSVDHDQAQFQSGGAPTYETIG